MLVYEKSADEKGSIASHREMCIKKKRLTSCFKTAFHTLLSKIVFLQIFDTCSALPMLITSQYDKIFSVRSRIPKNRRNYLIMLTLQRHRKTIIFRRKKNVGLPCNSSIKSTYFWPEESSNSSIFNIQNPKERWKKKLNREILMKTPCRLSSDGRLCRIK